MPDFRFSNPAGYPVGIVGGGRGTEPSMAPFANPYEDSQGWKQTD